MSELPKYHLGDQRADAILRPIALTLHELETRAAHYRDRLVLTPEDQEAVTAALAAKVVKPFLMVTLLKQSQSPSSQEPLRESEPPSLRNLRPKAQASWSTTPPAKQGLTKSWPKSPPWAVKP